MANHKCDSCNKEFAVCDAKTIVFGIDRDPSLRGAQADEVIECDAYARVTEIFPGTMDALRNLGV